MKFCGKVDLTKWEFNLPAWIKPAGLLEHISSVINEQFAEEGECGFACLDDDEPTMIFVYLPLNSGPDYEPKIEINFSELVDDFIGNHVIYTRALIATGTVTQEGAVAVTKLRDVLAGLIKKLDASLPEGQ